MEGQSTTGCLILEAKAGDTSALNELYLRYVQRVLAIVRARLGPDLRRKVESWDIVQDVMLTSLRDLDQFEYETDGAFVRWLAQIVENRICDQWRYQNAERREVRREHQAGTEELSRISDPSLPTPSQILMLRHDLELLERAMDTLSPDARELIIASKLEGRSYVEIAAEVGKTADAVRMSANRAMAALIRAFDALQRDGSEDEST